jgi:hypothetical protein
VPRSSHYEKDKGRKWKKKIGEEDRRNIYEMNIWEEDRDR